MNDYDKAGRYLVKREPTGFFRWLLANPAVSLDAWIDSRRVALPDQNDLTNDLVAVLRNGDELEGICLELEAKARADALTRLLEYMVRLWTEPGSPSSLRVSCVGGAVLDLTGRSPARKLSLRSTITPNCRLELTIVRRRLVEEKAAKLVADVAAGRTSPWLLPWVPLMDGGGESGTISRWLHEAARLLTDPHDRADLGLLVRVFATLAGCRPAWDHGLRGWNMNIETSPIFDEIRAVGREEGRAEGTRSVVYRQGRQKFGKAPTKTQQRTLEAITEVDRLEALAERLLNVDTWADLLSDV